MAEKFQPQTFDINSINNGNRFGYEGIQPEAVNAPIEAAAYMQALATNQPDNSEAELIGQPNVSIEKAEDGTPRFKFSNLKGKDGKDLSKEVKELQKTQEENKKSIINLYAITSPLYVQKTIEQSYSSRITANGENIFNEQFTPILKVEGSTVKTTNLLDDSFFVGKLLGTDLVSAQIPFTIRAGTYSIFLKLKKSTDVIVNTFSVLLVDENYETVKAMLLSDGDISKTNAPNIAHTFSLTEAEAATVKYVSFYFNAETGASYVGDEVKFIMLNDGDTIKPYSPYFTGLKNASFKGIKSTGRNLIPFGTVGKTGTVAGVTYEYLADGGVKLNGTSTEAGIITNTLLGIKSWKIRAGTYTLSGGESWSLYVQGKVVEDDKIGLMAVGNGATYTFEKDYTFRFNIRFSAGQTFNNVVVYPMLNSGKEVFPFEPYTEDTLELPEAIDCGLCTTIDFENQKIVENGVTIVLTGEEEWKNDMAYGGSYVSLMYATILPTVEYRVKYIATDGAVDGTVGKWVLSYGDLVILGAERYFGFTQFADPNDPTDEERDTLLAEWKAYLAQRYADGNPVTIRYVSSTVQAETPFTDEQKAVGNTYKAWNNGTETVEQGETDNSVYGALNKIEQTYFAPFGEETYE